MCWEEASNAYKIAGIVPGLRRRIVVGRHDVDSRTITIARKRILDNNEVWEATNAPGSGIQLDSKITQFAFHRK